MPRKPKDTKADPEPEAVGRNQRVLDGAQLQQAGRRLAVEHRRLKIAFADSYVELMGLREENGRLNEVIQEQQRVLRELSAKLPKDEPKKKATAKS